MAEVTAQAVKSLRDRTSAGMMECKRALQETGGDEEAAIDLLRRKGAAKAATRASRAATEGMVAIAELDGAVAMVAVSSETDFVARNEAFREFVSRLASAVVESDLDTGCEIAGEVLMDRPELASLNETLADLRSAIGENLQVRRGVRHVPSVSTTVGWYVHFGDKIGVVVEIADASPSEASRQLVRDIAMHVAATNPIGLSPDDIPQEQRDRERAIFIEQAKAEGKPESIAEKMVEGRMRKFFEQNSLTRQAYVKDPALRIDALVEQSVPGARIQAFSRFEVGG